ncbi:DsbA family protein [Candidatus Woesearchaeota archaeon]|nr:DsbA family protein [Candidatus Woesearchaeota archaeon]
MAEEKHHHKEEEHHKEVPKEISLKLDNWQVITIILVILLIASILTSGFRFGFGKDKVGEDAVKYLNAYVLAGQGIEAKLNGVTEENGLLKLKLDVGGKQFDSYVTNDGKFLFPSAIDLTQAPTTQKTTTSQPQKNIEVSIDDDPMEGNKNAPVTIVEFSDFQCPFCGKFYKEVFPEIETKYIKTGKVRLVFRDYPLGFHEFAQKASEAAECADEQGKFWQYHNKLFENQDALTISDLKKYAESLNLDAKKFDSCLDSGKYVDEIKKDMDDAESYGVSGTPAFFINGNLISGAQPFSSFEQVIEQELIK